MRFMLYLLVLAISVLLAGCVSNGAEQRNVSTHQADMHTAQISLDWAGIYVGVLPCASCSGIETELTLRGDSTYTLNEKYQDEDGAGYSVYGVFHWIDGTRVKLDEAGDYRTYFVGENILRMLDKDGNRVKGELADHYVLRKER